MRKRCSARPPREDFENSIFLSRAETREKPNKLQGFENNRNNRFRFVWTQRGHGDILRFMKNKPIREAEKKQMRERFMKLRVTVAEESSIRLAAAESRVTVSQFFRYAMNLAGVKL